MEIKHLLPEKGNFYKTCLHVHTTVSDGALTPEEIKELYVANGYSAVAFTDHQIMLPHPELNDESFLAITATEYAKNKGDYNLSPSLHFNLYAKDPAACTFPCFDPNSPWPRIEHVKNFYSEDMKNYKPIYFKYSKNDFNKVFEACNKAGFLVCFNHPKNGLQYYRDWSGIKGLFGMECYNHGSAEHGWIDNMDPIDSLLTEGERKIYPIASDDAHAKETCCHGYVMVKSPSLDYSVFMDSLEKGDFYASTGIHIEKLYLDGDILHIELDENGADECIVRANVRFIVTEKKHGEEPLRSISVDMSKLFSTYKKYCDTVDEVKNAYFRIELNRGIGTDKAAMARTKAYFLDEI